MNQKTKMTFLFTFQWGAGQLGELSRLIEEMISHGDTEIKENAIGTAVMGCDHSSVFLSRFSGKVVLATEDSEITEEKTFRTSGFPQYTSRLRAFA